MGWFRLEKPLRMKSNHSPALPRPPLPHIPTYHIHVAVKSLQGLGFCSCGDSCRFLGYLKHSKHPITCAQQSRGSTWGGRDFPLGLSLQPCPGVLLPPVSGNHPNPRWVIPHPLFLRILFPSGSPGLGAAGLGSPGRLCQHHSGLSGRFCALPWKLANLGNCWERGARIGETTEHHSSHP